MISVVLHSLHAALLIAAGIVVLVLLGNPRQHERRVARLRRSADPQSLVASAEAKARAQLLADGSGSGVGRRDGAVVALVVANATSAVVHGAVCPQHFAEGLRFGLFFLVLATVQLGLAAAAARGRVAAIVRATLVVNIGTVGLWLATRTTGLPFGLADRETVGTWDVLATAAEVVGVGAALVLASRARHSTAAPPADTAQRSTALIRAN